MGHSQPGILGEVPRLARYMSFSLFADADVTQALRDLADTIDPTNTVAGLGASLVGASGNKIDGLRHFPVHATAGIEIPSTPTALWLWLKGDDRGELVHRSRAIEHALAEHFELTDLIDAFQYGPSLDMTGYEDGTENPKDDEAVAAAIVKNQGAGLDGSSFVAVQQWVHDLDTFEDMSPQEQDHTIGRRKSDNKELDNAPASAHVKRTAQESFSPEAFIVRRSMPWANEQNTGLVFVAFGHSFDAFEALLENMLGLNDGIVDGLFQFTRPISGAYLWCPPIKDKRLDLGALQH